VKDLKVRPKLATRRFKRVKGGTEGQTKLLVVEMLLDFEGVVLVVGGDAAIDGGEHRSSLKFEV
jgi:hypothetical protein